MQIYFCWGILQLKDHHVREVTNKQVLHLSSSEEVLEKTPTRKTLHSFLPRQQQSVTTRLFSLFNDVHVWSVYWKVRGMSHSHNVLAENEMPLAVFDLTANT